MSYQKNLPNKSKSNQQDAQTSKTLSQYNYIITLILITLKL